MHPKVLLQQRHIHLLTFLKTPRRARRCRIRLLKAPITELGLVARLRGDNVVALAFVGGRAGRVGEAVVGEFDACEGVTGQR